METPANQPTERKLRRPRAQFSMRSLLITMTACCVVLAIPNGWVAVAVVLGWSLAAALIAWPMIANYRTIYHWIAGSPSSQAVSTPRRDR